MNNKQCRQCGEVKPIAQFRQYYGGRKGTYTICRMCEKINSRAKYLEKKQELTESDRAELDKIYTLYDAQQACGLQPPRREEGRSVKLVDNLDDMINKYVVRANQVPDEIRESLDTRGTPAELLEWLSVDLTEEPDYYLDEVYEGLKEKYRPVLRINPETLLPEYDDTHRVVLDKVLHRFNAYEDSYYNKEEDK